MPQPNEQVSALFALVIGVELRLVSYAYEKIGPSLKPF